jgi:uncharacterized protein YjbJ (UPF0337 family)
MHSGCKDQVKGAVKEGAGKAQKLLGDANEALTDAESSALPGARRRLQAWQRARPVFVEVPAPTDEALPTL